SGCDKLWCNARTSAVPLYDRAGFTKIGDEFEIDPIGPHFLMVRLIQHSSIDR
ncbi:MAG: GNAT family N-acetyltransferase, partial [Bdellovibrionaceae bacterium]|nr:GNAT family N-acetyltransferase [Pseudobdellovibrionaceae bacterium]